MPRYEHKKLIQAIEKLDNVPEASEAYSEWIKAEAHLSFLHQNASADELVISASAEYTFIAALIVLNERLTPIDVEDLMAWSLTPNRSVGSYVYGGESDKVWIEQDLRGTGTKTLENAFRPVFHRWFEGWSGPGKHYYELHQLYAHVTGIHWRPEEHAYCRFNEHGDLDPVVSVTTREDKGSTLNLVSFKWEPLERFLAVSGASLVRMFDFTLLRRSEFSGWPNEAPKNFEEAGSLFYHQKVMPGHAAYTRGVQIIRPRRVEKAIFDEIMGRPQHKKEYAEFSTYDWRNKRIAKISTDPSATTNYFNTKGNDLPFELSPAFFRPEVLLKYKADRDKYTVGEREISCRSAWHLDGIDINEAGQVHTYICDLRHLPYTEQLHWLSFNEPPRANISQRAVTNDFEGQFTTIVDPVRKVLSVVRRWHDEKVIWWTLRDQKLLERVNTPVTTSRDEWAEAFMNLAKLVVEGFELKTIRRILDDLHVQYEPLDQSISLLQKLLDKKDTSGDVRRFDGLRTVQLLRSKVKGHAGGKDADQLAHEALIQHETFATHFRHVCTQVAEELEIVEGLFRQPS